MKNYFKKFSIMFILLLTIMGIGAIHNGNIVSAATVGEQLTQPEDGWKRYDDADPNIKYSKDIIGSNDPISYNGTWHHVSKELNGTITFGFYGTKLRIISDVYPTYSNKIKITIDGVSDYYSEVDKRELGKFMVYEKTSLPLGMHTVNITKIENGSYTVDFNLDAIDINDTGYLIDPDSQISSISLDKTSTNLIVGSSQQVTATTTPAGAQIVWTSSDSSIATVDSTGKITGVKEGNVVITATTTDGSNLSASCTVNVTNPIVPTITLNKTSDSLVIGQTDNLVATTTPSGAQVTWASNDPSIVTVDSTGKVTGLKEGQATITATTADGLTATCAVTVIPKTAEPTNPDPTDSDKIVNIAHAKGDNTNNAGGDVTIIFHGAADTTLSVVKTADVKEVWVGDNFTYTIVITNTGTKTAKAVVVNDPAPNHIDFSVNGVTSTQGTVDPSSTSKNIIVNVGDIPPLGTVTIKIPATVIL